jgi:hypothetical protein
MARTRKPFDVYLEAGKKRVFAGALEWPGWCRSGKDEPAALETLLAYGPRYAAVVRASRLRFSPPRDIGAFSVVERLKGDATTDFGAPSISPSLDGRPVDSRQLLRFRRQLESCWMAFDAAVRAARGKELRKGPRGGGRDLDKIVRHVLDADGGYLARLGGKHHVDADVDPRRELRRIRSVIVDTLSSAVRGEVPPEGPRGGTRWTPRYYVRRSAWHVLDHAWEIEDRATET